MKRLGYCFGAVPFTALVVCTWGNFARAEVQTTQAVAPSWSNGPGAQGLALLPRGGGGDELFAGDPTCIPLANSAQVGAQGGFMQECGDGQWVSLAYPVLTSGETIESINIIHNTNTGEGDLYLMGDCGGNPDTNNILWAGCGCIQGTVSGAVTNYCLGESLVDPPSTTWVVAVFRDDFSFDIAFDDGNHAPGHTFGSLLDTGNCGDWDDLNDFGFGGCSWVSLVVAGSPGLPECCDSPALCDGDVNGDGLVDPLDSGFILARFGLDASDPANCQADANCDGLIDPLDSGYVLARFGVCNDAIECPLGGGEPGECGDGGGDCGDPSCPPPTSDCCEIHTDPGCDAVCGSPDGGGVEDCVCAVDDFCCESTWDQACVDIVELFSCADCSDNNPDCAECVSNEDCSVPGNECIGSSCTCVETAPVNDDCADVTPVDLPVFSGSSIELSGMTNCASTTVCDALGADSVWNAFTIDTDSDVNITWCGSPVTHSPQYFVIDTDCPCTGDFIFADTNAFGLCGGGGADNMTADYLGLTAGTYYVPSYAADDSTGLGEDYTITVSIP